MEFEPHADAKHTIADCANDLQALFSSLSLTPTLLAGHSLSGKIALKYLEQCNETNLPVPQHTWILDSIPAIQSPPTHVESVHHILSVIAENNGYFDSRDEMFRMLLAKGISKPVAHWLTSSIDKYGSQFTWTFDITIAQQLYTSFINLDMLPMLANHERSHIHFIRAGRNTGWSDDILSYFEGLYNPHVMLHTMPHVGHWLHAEDLPGMLDVMTKHSQLS